MIHGIGRFHSSVYARMQDPECWAQGHASPCMGLAHARKAIAFGDFDSDEWIPKSSYPLRDQVSTGAWRTTWLWC